MAEESTFRKKLGESDMLRMMIPKAYWRFTFEEISEYEDDECSPKEIARRYLSKLPEMMTRGVGLLLWGKNGRGKSGIAVVIAKEARRRGYTVLYAESSDLKRSVIEKVAFDEDISMWERARSVDMLVLDDLGKGTQDRTGFGARLLDELIRHRNANGRVTLISTNMNPTEKQLEDELKASTIHSLKECVIPCEIVGHDRREEKREELKGLLSAEG